MVGTGPVGMALALEFERLGRDVLVLESGGLALNGPAVDNPAAEASRASIADTRRHAPMELAVCRALGGTSWTWGGRCVPYDDVDFLDRAFVADAHWPVTHDEIRPWYKAATDHMLCGSDTFDFPYSRQLTDGLTVDFVERWAIESRLILLHREKLLNSTHIKLSLNSTVTGFNFSQDGQTIESLAVQTPSDPIRVKARQIILATGGVEATRILLNVQKKAPQYFGGVDGPLGRYYMGHISGKIASIRFDRPADFADLDFKLDVNGSWIRRRFMLTTEAQVENKVLNTAFWPDNPPFYDPGHRSGVLSSVFIALAFPPVGRKLLSEAIRLAHTGPRPYRLAAHLRNAIFGAPKGALDIYRILRDRFLRKPKKPGFLVSNSGGKYALHYHAEQVPNAESRITLSSDPAETDSFGMARAAIDLRFVEQDIDSVIESHNLLDKALRSNGIGHLEFWYSGAKLRERIWDQAADGFHQVGTIRMGTDPKKSVVDPDLKIHGLTNLYIASSAVFPTAGQANSTLLAGAFAMRLAHRLAGHSADSPTSKATL
ncbi:GMC oxidoreductase [Acidicapsa ligni]|uniref:GMC oxidoreductase n=1 Tax=Acidicapsa ligni TaxID=542300 RepID=UPI0021E034D0|nr:GMC oxidoreductase [Acidicapsa ligni]